jgi:hypothetical protein
MAFSSVAESVLVNPGAVGVGVAVVICDRRFRLALSKPSRKANAAFANTIFDLLESGEGRAVSIFKLVCCGSILYSVWP